MLDSTAARTMESRSGPSRKDMQVCKDPFPVINVLDSLCLSCVSDTTLLVQLHIGWRLLLSKGYKNIDRDARWVWDNELKESK
jgi:hypothetical protein